MGGLVLVCRDRGRMPRLHRSDGCAVWVLEPFEGFALFVAILRKAEMGLGSPAARKCEACVSEARLESASAGLRCVLGPRN